MFKNNKSIWLISPYLLTLLGLFFYSFTQVDLGLTLTRASFFQGIQKSFQYIGYFNRPVSTYLFVGIIALLFLFYFLFLFSALKGYFDLKKIWKIIILATVILTFSYNAFSYDLFNYIFDARIVTYYHQNPYEKKAQDYPTDRMRGFMHWTQRTYPYGPVWLGVTVPLSVVASNVFAINLVLFKLLAAASFLGTVYFLSKLLQVHHSKDVVTGLVFFALNPLVLIESLVSAHNDTLMMFFAVAALYFLLQKKYVGSLLLLLLSIGIKFATILMLPSFAYIYWVQWKRKNISWFILLLLIFLPMLIGVHLASARTNFQPWYLLLVLPFSPLFLRKVYVAIPTLIASLIALINYVPFLYTGNWDPPIPQLLAIMNWSIVGISLIGIFWYWMYYKRLDL